jgi:hypothetical protein
MRPDWVAMVLLTRWRDTGLPLTLPLAQTKQRPVTKRADACSGSVARCCIAPSTGKFVPVADLRLPLLSRENHV